MFSKNVCVAWLLRRACLLIGVFVFAGCAGGEATPIGPWEIQAGSGAGPPLGQVPSIALDIQGNRLLVVDLDLDSVIAVDLASGDRSLVSHPTLVGSGPAFGYPSGIVLDAAARFAYVADPAFAGGLSAVVRVELATGSRVIVSGPGVGGGPPLGDPWDVALDEVQGFAYVVDRILDGVMRIDLLTGDRVVLSHALVGLGPVFSDPYSLVLDAARDRLLVADFALGAVFSVDTITGDRAILSDATQGVGPNLVGAVQIRLDWLGRALVTDNMLDALFSIDPVSGDRTVVSGQLVGGGPAFERPHCVAAGFGCTFVADTDADAVFAVDLDTGDRIIISQ